MSEGPIIVGTDGTDTAVIAARTAASLAAATGRALHIVSAYAAEAPASLQHRFGPKEADAARDAAERTALAVGELVDTVVTDVAQGTVADVLVREADRLDASLIVVGNRRVQGIARVLGSVATAVAHHAPCDVYIAHTH